MMRRNLICLAVTILVLLSAHNMPLKAQITIKREADYLNARRAIAARMESLEQTEASVGRRQTIQRSDMQRRPVNAQSEAAAPLYFGADEKFAGRTISDYSGDYLHFLFSRPIDPQVAEFEKRSKGMEFQHGPVCFLTPTSDGSPEREVIVSKNTPIFFSLGWAFGFLEDAEPDEAMLGLRSFLSSVPDAFTDFDVTLDYESLPREAIIATQSPTTYFPLLAETAEAFGLGTMARIYSRAAIGGNFVLLKPLNEGTHVLKIRFNDAEGNRYLREYYFCVL